MEFLIPGLILVAIMAWASTRIKKNAAAAFDAETIDAGDFVIKKPAGFLHVLNDSSGLAFRAYAKEFGTVGRKDVRQATAEVSVIGGESADARRGAVVASAETVVSDSAYLDAGKKAYALETVEIIDGGEFRVFYKIAGRSSKVVELRVVVLAEHEEANRDKVEELLDGFHAK